MASFDYDVGAYSSTATVIPAAERRSELVASRRRIVAAADDACRRIERDLHDGVQQQLVSLALKLGVMRADPPSGEALREQLAGVTEEVGLVLEALVEIARGVHPAVLSQGGLEPALKSLVRRSAVPVELKVRTGRRLPERVEVAIYYLVSEALTNVAKHAQASVVHISLEAEGTSVQVVVGDDGVGGADPARGSGLIGLRDRVETLGGRIAIASPAGYGTLMRVEIPIDDE